MAQIKIYGIAEKLNPIKSELSNIIHNTVVEILQLTPDKRFHRFFPLEKVDFYYPPDRSENYLIIEIAMFEGRTIDTKKQLLRQLIKNIHHQFGIAINDIEISILEIPQHNWGIRGLPGDELVLGYKVEV
ncbi:MAG TPA: tautomerase family protein [Nostocaceae cyanobacterium]|nr:tautomerase family protein [Nostocaceae cyanobacterium]